MKLKKTVTTSLHRFTKRRSILFDRKVKEEETQPSTKRGIEAASIPSCIEVEEFTTNSSTAKHLYHEESDNNVQKNFKLNDTSISQRSSLETSEESILEQFSQSQRDSANMERRKSNTSRRRSSNISHDTKNSLILKKAALKVSQITSKLSRALLYLHGDFHK